jgi:hypothetical protein
MIDLLGCGRRRVPDVEYKCGSGTNVCQIIRTPFNHPEGSADRSLEQRRASAHREFLVQMRRVLYLGQRWMAHEGGQIARFTGGLMYWAATDSFRWEDVQIAELRPQMLNTYEGKPIPGAPAGEYIWEGGFYIPPTGGS